MCQYWPAAEADCYRAKLTEVCGSTAAVQHKYAGYKYRGYISIRVTFKTVMSQFILRKKRCPFPILLLYASYLKTHAHKYFIQQLVHRHRLAFTFTVCWIAS